MQLGLSTVFHLQRTVLEAITVCSCKAVHDQYGMEHFYNARLEESIRLSKLKDLQPQGMAEMTATVLVCSLALTHNLNPHCRP